MLTTQDEQPAAQGNLLLDHLYGADVRFVPPDDPMLAVGHDEAVVAEVVAEEARAGRAAYVIPVGGSSAVGALGYVAARWSSSINSARIGVAPSRLYYASGSRGTQAGLTLGAKLLRRALPAVGRRGQRRRAGEDRARAAASPTRPRRCSAPHRRRTAPTSSTDQGYIGEGYGIPTAGAWKRSACWPDRGHPPRPGLHVQGDGRAHRHVRAGEIAAQRDRRLPAHRRLPCSVHARRNAGMFA